MKIKAISQWVRSFSQNLKTWEEVNPLAKPTEQV